MACRGACGEMCTACCKPFWLGVAATGLYVGSIVAFDALVPDAAPWHVVLFSFWPVLALAAYVLETCRFGDTSDVVAAHVRGGAP